MAVIARYRVAGKVKARYVAKSALGNCYRWCEQSAENPRYDIAQGTCDAEDLPDDVKIKCDTYDGSHYACEWPLI